MKLMPPTPEHMDRAETNEEFEADLSPDLVHVARSLHEEFDQRLGRDLVDHEIQLSAAQFSAAQFSGARVRAFVPLFVARFCGAVLREDCRPPDQRARQ
jgi:hypothetical protein